MIVLVWVAVGVLGGVGAVARFRLDDLVQIRTAGEFPVGTLTVNIVGSFLLGLLTGAGISGDGMLLAGAATLGSFTTFSTWMLETERLVEDGEDRLALVNLALSLLGGVAAAVVGWAVEQPYEQRLLETLGLLRRVRPDRRPVAL